MLVSHNEPGILFFCLFVVCVCMFLCLYLQKLEIRWYNDVATASVYSEKTRLKNLIMIIIIIIMNKSQELKVFHGRQKLTSAKN